MRAADVAVRSRLCHQLINIGPSERQKSVSPSVVVRLWLPNNFRKKPVVLRPHCHPFGRSCDASVATYCNQAVPGRQWFLGIDVPG